jgi:hypothetical protein
MSEEQEQRFVFLLWHSTPLDDHPTSPETDDKLLGVFDSQGKAEAAKAAVLNQPGSVIGLIILRSAVAK